MDEFRRLADLLTGRSSLMGHLDRLLLHVREAYREIPHLKLTIEGAWAAFGVDHAMCEAVFGALVEVRFLRLEGNGFTAGWSESPGRSGAIATQE